jgi:hypothetical protein
MSTLHSLNKELQGNYNRFDKGMMQRHAVGKQIMMFRKYIYTSLRARWGRERFDWERGDEVGGFYRQYWSKIATEYDEFREKANAGMFGEGGRTAYAGAKVFGRFAGRLVDSMLLKQPSKYLSGLRMALYDGMDSKMAVAVARANFELAFVTGMFVVASTAFDDDDDDKFMGSTFLELELRRAYGDWALYLPVFSIEPITKVVKNPITAMSTLNRLTDLLMQLAFNPTEEYQRAEGPWEKGDSKLWAKTLKSFPIANQWIKLWSLDSQLEYQKLVTRTAK